LHERERGALERHRCRTVRVDAEAIDLADVEPSILDGEPTSLHGQLAL
jgi:hypothetical protein